MEELKIYTPEEFADLEAEKARLLERQEENKKAISTARDFGDLSENSEYTEAKNEQEQIAAKLAEVNHLIAHARVLDESEIDKSRVSIGSVVTIFNKERNKEMVYQIVGSFGTDPLAGKISDASPIGIALVGGRVGDEVVVSGAREQHLTILKIERNSN